MSRSVSPQQVKAQHRDDGQRQDQGGKGQQAIDEALQERIELPAPKIRH